MKVWLYYRLSRDEDAELNSLNNQRNILVEYANANNHEIVGESFDDNVSGMHFNREGISKIYEQVENKAIDAIIVKDLSRLGRHRTQTAMFIDYLREHDVRVLSVTENIDTSNEDDDLMIGFKGIFNDMYARDISKKIRAGYKQKQKNGIVITVPLGYFKDKNTNEIVIVEEEAEIVRKIFDLYLSGYGLKAIAKKLNDEGIKSPQYYQNKMYNKKLPSNKPEITGRYLWVNTTVKRILQNEFYIGTVTCHKTYTSKINHIRKVLPEEEQFKHENFAPAIISKDKWEQVQFLLSSKRNNNVRASSSNPCHRYTGLIECGDCGCTFVCKKRKWKDKPERIEYNCNGYHRYGKEHCTAHRIDEEYLDKLIYDELMSIKDEALANYKSIESDVKKWMSNKSSVNNKLKHLNTSLEQRKSDQKEILLERIRDREHADIYTEMLEKCESDIQKFEDEIKSIQDYNSTIKKRKAEMKDSVEIIEEIIKEGAISDANLRLLVNKIIIFEKDKKLSIKIKLNAKFQRHKDCYNDNGIVLEKIFIKIKQNY
ncbi:MAG TPA: recombinase family protein [Ruminococcus bromii]|nr:recombinase family protein [Ruminococcus bromii]HJI86528.1 recombinase family protein [Ruminococcus bromii]